METNRVLLVVLNLISIVAGTLVPTGASFLLHDVNYFVSPFSQGKAFGGSLDTVSHRSQFGFIPITIVSHYESPTQLESLFNNWTTADDVWQPGFLEAILLQGADELTKANITHYINIESDVFPLLEDCVLPSGPYFLNVQTGEVHQAFRLYDDFSGAFTQSLLQGPDGRFQTLSAQVPSSASLTIGVPSRLYFEQTEEMPLAGVRVGVKDIFSLAGIKTSCGNRAWHGLYPPSNITSSAIQNLVDAGAVVVGLQKLAQFANGEAPTADWVDYHAPFNPRGDGYQDTASSSAGAGASIGSYDWLDIAVGSDTGGSIRGPANNQGLFGNRPSHGLVRLDDVMPLSPELDTAGFLARDPQIWDAASAAMYKENYTLFGDRSPKYPKQIYVLDFPAENTSYSRILNRFATDLAQFLNTTITPLNLDKEWQTSGPSQVKHQSISELLNLTYTALITMDQTKLVRDTFYRDYATAHDGRYPFVDPSSLVRWGWGDKQPESIRTEAMVNKTLFMDWFNEKILPRNSDPLICSSGFLLHTDSTGYLTPRNRYLPTPELPFGFSNGEISVFTETPDSVFPLGQVPLFSSITNHTEYLPVSVDVIAAKGCDGLIAQLANDLVEAGILKVPMVGSSLDGGRTLLR